MKAMKVLMAIADDNRIKFRIVMRSVAEIGFRFEKLNSIYIYIYVVDFFFLLSTQYVWWDCPSNTFHAFHPENVLEIKLWVISFNGGGGAAAAATVEYIS